MGRRPPPPTGRKPPRDGITRNGLRKKPTRYGWPYESLVPVHGRRVSSSRTVTKDKCGIRSRKSFANRFPRSKNSSPTHRWGIRPRRCSRTSSMARPARTTTRRSN
jgi:hypothetical protein